MAAATTLSAAKKLITENIDLWTSAIKAKNTQGRGSSTKRELYGIKKLRELILELAVRGKLVPQDPADEPASVLLERITAAKAELVKDKKIKKQKPLPEVSEDEKPFDLPNGWEWTQLGKIAEIGPRNNLDDDLEVSFVPMPMISTSYKGDHEQEIRVWSEIKTGYTHFANGDIGIAKITPCFENSKAAVFKDLKNGYGAGTTELHIARPIDGTVDPLFILLYLKAPMFLEKGKPKMTGSAGQKRVPNDFFSGNPLPFAPLAEQHRIVAKVDELMSLCDQLEQQTEASLDAHQLLVDTLLATLTNAKDANELSENWARMSEHFDTLITTDYAVEQLKQTILQLAVMGKLVPQDPNDEPASELLKRIAAKKAQLIKDRKIKKQKPLPEITDEEKPFELPSGWEWATLSHFGYFFGGKTPSKMRPEYWNGDIAWVTPKDMKSRFTTSAEDHVTQLAVDDGLTRVSKESLLFVVRSGILRRHFPVSISRIDCTVNQDLKVLTPFEVGLSHYLLLMMRGFESYILENLTKKGTTVESLMFEEFSKHYFIVPPEKEQHRILAVVEQLLVLCDQLKVQLGEAQAIQLQLADTVVSDIVGVSGKKKEENKADVEMMKITTMLTLNLETFDDNALIAPILLELGGSADAKEAWGKTTLSLPEFYAQLKAEIEAGYINRPARAKIERE